MRRSRRSFYGGCNLSCRLTTLAQLKTALGISGVDQDTLLEPMLDAAESAFQRLIDRQLCLTEYTEYYSGRGTKVLLLNEYPVTAVTDVRVDSQGFWGSVEDSFPATTAYTSGIHYALVKDGRASEASTGKLYHIPSVWPAQWRQTSGTLSLVRRPGAGNIRVTYTAGYDVIPADVQKAVWDTVAALMANGSLGRPMMEEKYEEYAYKLASLAESYMQIGSAANVVQKYRRLRQRYEVMS